jgi:hypothetical protein
MTSARIIWLKPGWPSYCPPSGSSKLIPASWRTCSKSSHVNGRHEASYTHNGLCTVCANNIVCAHNFTAFECNVNCVVVVALLHPNDCLGSADLDSKVLQLSTQLALRDILGKQQHVWKAGVCLEVGKVSGEEIGCAIVQTEPRSLDTNLDQGVSTTYSVQRLR